MSWKLDLDLSYTDTCFTNDEGDIRFEPPMYHQRYCMVAAVLQAHPAIRQNVTKLVEFGCADMKFFLTVKHQVPHIQELIEVDIDKDILLGGQFRIQPLIVDYVSRREVPLTVTAYCGSVSDSSAVLKGADVVVAIELIEHLFPETLDGVPDNVFGYIRPKIALFTTPNSEINGMFPGLTGFRHDDHKFEWTRAEFAEWANEICEKYTDYSVSFYDIGRGLAGFEDKGGVSQMAVFIRDDMKRLIDNWEATDKPELEAKDVPDLTAGTEPYEMVVTFTYPHDARTERQKLLDDTKYKIHILETQTEEDETGIISIPLQKLVEDDTLNVNLADLRALLIEDGYTVIEDNIHIDTVDRGSSSEYDGGDGADSGNENNKNSCNVVQNDSDEEEDWD